MYHHFSRREISAIAFSNWDLRKYRILSTKRYLTKCRHSFEFCPGNEMSQSKKYPPIVDKGEQYFMRRSVHHSLLEPLRGGRCREWPLLQVPLELYMYTFPYYNTCVLVISWSYDHTRRSLMDDGIIEIQPTNFDFSQILIVMLNWLIPN